MDIKSIANFIEKYLIYVFGILLIISPFIVIVLSYINKKYYDIPPIVYINVGFISLFISLFFFTIVAKEENKILENQIHFLFNDLFNNIFMFVPSEKLESIKKIIKEAKLPNLSKEDKEVKKSNKILFHKAIKVLSILAGICVFFSFLTSIAQSGKTIGVKIKDWIKTFGQAIILLFVIAITQFSFLYLIPIKYKSLDPNEIKYFILDFIKNATIKYKKDLVTYAGTKIPNNNTSKLTQQGNDLIKEQ